MKEVLVDLETEKEAIEMELVELQDNENQVNSRCSTSCSQSNQVIVSSSQCCFRAVSHLCLTKAVSHLCLTKAVSLKLFQSCLTSHLCLTKAVSKLSHVSSVSH